MISLDPILQAAQDGDTHQPIINIVSSSFSETIPFDGNDLKKDNTSPDIIEHSSGSMVCVSCNGGTLTMLITDTEKNEWSDHTLYAGYANMKPSVCELSDGNLGVVFSDEDYRLYSLLVDLSGSIIESASLINNYSTWISKPSVTAIANGSYFLVYSYYDGSTYSMLSRTSDDFLTWGPPSTISISGLSNNYQIDNPDVLQLSDGQIMIVFDYVDSVSDSGQNLINCYQIESDDVGTTWSSPVNTTNYTTTSSIGVDPVIAEKSNGDVELVFVEQKPLLYMNPDTDGWVGEAEVPNMHYNPATGKLIFCHVNTDPGTRFMDAITVVDVESWTIEKDFTTTSSPSFNSFFAEDNFWFDRDLGEGSYLCGGAGHHLIIVDTDTETITYRSLTDRSEYGFQANITGIDWDPTDGRTDNGFEYTQTDSDNNLLYVMVSFNYQYEQTFRIGYFGITEQADPVTGEYEYHPIVNTDYVNRVGPRSFRAVPDMNYMIVPFNYSPYSHSSTLRIYAIDSENTILYEFDSDNNPGFHRNGIYDPVYSNGHIYGDTVYEDGYEQGDRYGLMDINLSTGAILYHRPSWGTYDNYNLNQKRVLDDGRILMVSEFYGITIFNPADGKWVLYNNDNVPGLNTVIGDGWSSIDYDPVNKIIFASTDTNNDKSGIVAFPEEGSFNQIKYISGTYSSSWSWGDIAVLVSTYTDFEPTVAIDSNDAIWAFWESISVEDSSLRWDCEIAEKNLINYLTNDPVTLSWEIDSVSTLIFTLSHGYLFDQSNLLSTLSRFLKKGRKVNLSIGETVSGIDCLQSQGVYLITETKISYERGEYPTIAVTCDDRRVLWEDGHVVATEYYSDQSPNNVLSAVAEDFGNLDSSDIDFPTIVDSHNLYHQFLDQDVSEILTEILEHYGYFLYFTPGGAVSAKKIDLEKEVDHVYTDGIINYTPDDSFSSFVNRVVVTGEGQYFIEVLYDSESVGSVTGTVLPFGGTKVYRIWYSDDHVRTCRDPELSINTSIRAYSLFLMKGGGDEYISATDLYERWCEVTMEAPDLTGVYIGIAVAILATGTAAVSCTLNCGGFIFALAVETQLLGYAIGAFAQYDYEVFARPIGEEKQTFQAEANDYVLQQELNGQVITQEIDDPFCYTIQTCQSVAERELDIVKAQRKRVSFSKPSHLQDEIGDIIQVNHPYSGMPVKIFVTAITRTWQKGVGVIDKIEGWRV